MKAIKTYTVFAGVNGAGKSTLYAADNSDNLGLRLNSDDIVRTAGADWRSVEAQLEAGRNILKMQDECFNKGLSLNQETTLCGNSIIRAIKRAKGLGYVLHMRYVGVENPQIAKDRVLKRIALGGHGVSESTIDRRYGLSFENLIKIFPLFDSVNLYDNSGIGLVLVAYSLNGKLVRTPCECVWADKIIEKIKI